MNMDQDQTSKAVELSAAEKSQLLNATCLADRQMKAWIEENGGIDIGEDPNDCLQNKPL